VSEAAIRRHAVQEFIFPLLKDEEKTMENMTSRK
jgi:hypothetical protein